MRKSLIKSTMTFDASKEGWASLEDAYHKASKISLENKDIYVYMFVDFRIVSIKIGTKSLTSSVMAPRDYPCGYWKNGKHSEWSESRKIKNSNYHLDGVN